MAMLFESHHLERAQKVSLRGGGANPFTAVPVPQLASESPQRLLLSSYGQRLVVSKATGPQLGSGDSVRSKDSIARVGVYDITRADSTSGQSDSPSTLAESVVVGLTSPCPWRVKPSHLPTPTSV